MMHTMRAFIIIIFLIIMGSCVVSAADKSSAKSDTSSNAIINDPKNVDAASSGVVPGSKKKTSPYFKISTDKDDKPAKVKKNTDVPKETPAVTKEKPVQPKEKKEISDDNTVIPSKVTIIDNPEEPVDVAGLTIVEAEMCQRMADHKPVGISESFSGDIKSLTCFSRIKSSQETSVKHIWYCNGEKSLEVTLKVGQSRNGWRAYSSKVMKSFTKGEWKVDIVASDGTLIKSLPFTVN